MKASKTKKVLSLILASAMSLALLAGCGGTPASNSGSNPTPNTSGSTGTPPANDPAPLKEGKVFNIYAWNEEFKGFFEKYYKVPEGVTVNWIITPNTEGAYQDKLDAALMGQAGAADDDKVDMFLAEEIGRAHV